MVVVMMVASMILPEGPKNSVKSAVIVSVMTGDIVPSP